MRYDLRLEREGWVTGVATAAGDCGLCGRGVDLHSRVGYNAFERVVACEACVGTVRPRRYRLTRDGTTIYAPDGGMSLSYASRMASTFPGEVEIEPIDGGDL